MGYLVQERKIATIPEAIEVHVAEIVPRHSIQNITLGFPYFTKCSYWPAEQFWSCYIGVPFYVIQWAIENIGQRILSNRTQLLRLPVGGQIARRGGALVSLGREPSGIGFTMPAKARTSNVGGWEGSR